MIYKKIYLKNEYKFLKDSKATLEIYCHVNETDCPKDRKRYPLLILPGGAYMFCSAREKDPVVFSYLAQGFNCFALTYTCNEKYPVPQLEVACAMDYIEKHTKEYGLIPNSKLILGFSAGGHLSASYSRYYEELAKSIKLNKDNIKPIFQILCYPVVSMHSNTHSGTKEVITGNDKTLIKKLSIEKNITKDYPPTYIWTTKEDASVPISNSSDLYKELRKKGIPTKLHIYPHGVHGKSVCTNETEFSYKPLKKWMFEMQNWVGESTQFFYKTIKTK